MSKLLKILLVCLSLTIILCLIYYQKARPHDLEVYFLNVGQGDSILIRTPDNQDILIDGGPDKKVLSRLSEILPFWDRDIELMLLTHPHDDHLTGLIAVLESYTVQEVIYNQINYESSNFEVFKELLREKNIQYRESFYGDKIFFSENSYLETLYPFLNTNFTDIENINNTSIINRLVYGETEFLFTGDAEIAVEEILLYNQIELAADLLKVGHHGSKTASSKEFLSAVQPEIAVIQCGQGNKFNHPHFKTLLALQNLSIQLWRNDLEGTIKCASNAVDINCQKML